MERAHAILPRFVASYHFRLALSGTDFSPVPIDASVRTSQGGEIPMARREEFRRIGVLLPSSNSVQEADFWRALPPGFTLHVARMGLSNVEADSTLRVVQEIEAESKKLADADVDVIVFAATAPSARRASCWRRRGARRSTGPPRPSSKRTVLRCWRRARSASCATSRSACSTR